MDQDRDIGELLRQAQEGKKGTFQQIYELTYSKNYFLVYKMIQNEQDTLDILQDTYIKIYQRLGQVKKIQLSSFMSWSGKVATTTALDFMRKRKRITFSENGQIEEILPSQGFSYYDAVRVENLPEPALEQKEIARLVQELLKVLSDEQRVCVIMYYFQEMSIREIADCAGCSENTIKSRLSYARKKIQARMPKELMRYSHS